MVVVMVLGVLCGTKQIFRSQRKLNSCFVPESALISMAYKKKKIESRARQGTFLSSSPFSAHSAFYSGIHILRQLKEDRKTNVFMANFLLLDIEDSLFVLVLILILWH